MGHLVEQLKKYFETATPEQLEEDWKELEPWQDIGPSAEEYIEYVLRIREEMKKKGNP